MEEYDDRQKACMQSPEGGTYGGKSQAVNAPTHGHLEDMPFDCGARMRPGNFQSNIERLDEHLADAPKRQGPMTLNAIKTQR